MKRKLLFFGGFGLLVQLCLVNSSMSSQGMHTPNTEHLVVLCENDVKVIKKGQSGYRSVKRLSQEMDKLVTEGASEIRMNRIQLAFDSEVARICGL